MSRAATPAGAAPDLAPDWHSIDWKAVYRNVRRLQARIVKAVREGRWNKVKSLVYLLGLDPIAETLADGHSYGFRLERCCADALDECHKILRGSAGSELDLGGGYQSMF